MTSIHITIERDRQARPSSSGSRFRVKIAAQPGAHPLLVSARNCGSVAKAKREAELIFGELDWRSSAESEDVRMSAVVELQAACPTGPM